MSSKFVYPANPGNVPEGLGAVTPGFRKEVSKVFASIIFFLVVYCILVILSLLLATACFYAAIAIVSNVTGMLPILAAIGLAATGIMVFAFLVKFVFAVHKYDRSGLVEVTEVDQPTLFKFIRQVVADTKSQYPKKVFLSADVNACVFYDSGFWSMFLPIRKNLQIGLGLVNSVNVSEFKAVLAHEFGHFSQRSMKLGSFVYNVNRVIYNMLYENEGYGKSLQGFANVSGVFAVFAEITSRIAKGIQWILRQVYTLINRNYMGLSREMEYNADAVAASVAGSKSIISALRRIEVASHGYDFLLNRYNDYYSRKQVAANLYPHHSAVVRHIAAENAIPLSEGLPVMTQEFVQARSLSRINYKDQWASHPSTDDREAHLENFPVEAELSRESPWVLFDNVTDVQVKVTASIYPQNSEEEFTSIGEGQLEEFLKGDQAKFSFPPTYGSYFDSHLMTVFDTDQLDGRVEIEHINELFDNENCNLPKKMEALAADIEIIKAIGERRIQAKNFDLDGEKYERSDVPLVTEKLQAELEQGLTKLRWIDRQMILYFKNAAERNGVAEEFMGSYSRYFSFRKQFDEYLEVIRDMYQVLDPILSGQTLQVEEIQSILETHNDVHEKKLKGHLEKWVFAGAFEDEADLKTTIRDFIHTDRVYFSGRSYFDNEFRTLQECVSNSCDAINKFIVLEFRAILEKQLSFIAVERSPA